MADRVNGRGQASVAAKAVRSAPTMGRMARRVRGSGERGMFG
jgi:hypothetical protein